MEDGLSRNEMAYEDGHITRDLDSIEDDLNAIIRVKKDFLYAVGQLVDLLGKSVDKDAIVGSEEQFDEALYSEWHSLMEEYRANDEATGNEPVYPISAFTQEWRAKQVRQFRPQPTRGTAPTNPATLAASGKEG